MRRFRYEYGASPVHLLVAIGAFAVSIWALSQALNLLSSPSKFLIWFLGAIVLHDLVFYPLLSLLGLGTAGVICRGDRPSRLRIAALNHLRVPALLSGLMLLVFYPLILSQRAAGFERTTGMSTEVYMDRWLVLTAVLFLSSALLLAVRARRLRVQG